MSPRTRAGGLAVLVSVLVGGAGPAVALSPAAGPSLHDGPAAPTATPTPSENQHEHEAPSPTPSPSDAHEHDHGAPAPTQTDEHGDHGTTPPDDVSDTTRTLVIGGFGALNVGVLAVAALVRRRQPGPRTPERPGTRR